MGRISETLFLVFLTTILMTFEVSFGNKIAEELSNTRTHYRNFPIRKSKSGNHILYAQKANHDVALYICKKNGAQLVSIEDGIEEVEVTTLLAGQGSDGAWTSGKRVSVAQNDFKWESTGQLVISNSYDNWEKGAPKVSGEIDCILTAPNVLVQGYSWKVESCTEKHHVICEV